MHKYGHHVLSLNKLRQQCGLTLIELMVTLVILSILAASALPYAGVAVQRNKELELRRALREIRTAIDHFHDDWGNGKISKLNSDASDDGYPKTLSVLVDGTEGAQAKDNKIKYLRRIPSDPFGDAHKNPEDQWVLRGYQDDKDAITWNGKDVFDIHTASQKTALDGSHYKDW